MAYLPFACPSIFLKPDVSQKIGVFFRVHFEFVGADVGIGEWNQSVEYDQLVDQAVAHKGNTESKRNPSNC